MSVYSSNSFLKTKVRQVFLIFFSFTFIGTLGYVLIDGYSFIDALYMTVITLTTVGFAEVKPLSDLGRLFTIFLIISGVGAILYSINVLAAELLDGSFVKSLKQKRLENQIKELSGHVIVCGFGRNGRQASRKLLSDGKPFVVIDRDFESAKNSMGEEIPEVIKIEGNTTQDEILLLAGIDRADALIAALPSDSENMFTVLSARQLNADLHIVSRSSSSSSVKKLKIAGANNVIMPDRLGGDHMASLVTTPDILEFMDKIQVDSSSESHFKEISSEQLNPKFQNKTLQEIDIKGKTGCLVIGFKDSQGEYMINPDLDTVVGSDTNLILLGRPSQIKSLSQILLK